MRKPLAAPAVDDPLVREEIAKRHAREDFGAFCARLDPDFVLYRHSKAIIEHLQALERREIENLMIAVPPRYGKTYLSCIRYPAWWLGRHPTSGVIVTSYAAELAYRSSRGARGIIQDPRWPFDDVAISPESRAMDLWTLKNGGQLLAAGVGGGITGFGCKLLSIDDAFANREEADSPTHRDRVWSWYGDVARTRLERGGQQVLTNTRWHPDDLAGRILDSKFGQRWTVLSLPCYAEENDPLGRAIGELLWPEGPVPQSVEDGEISSRSFAALYQQRPVPESGETFKSEWLQNRFERRPECEYVLAALDGAWKTGVSNDPSCIQLWGLSEGRYCLLDVWKMRVDYPTLKAKVVAYHEQHRPALFLVEEAASGFAIVADLRSSHVPVVAVKPVGSKEARVDGVLPLFESGKVWLPKEAPWLADYVAELLQFPAAKHDDQVDATSMALARLKTRAKRGESRTFWAIAHEPGDGFESEVDREIPDRAEFDRERAARMRRSMHFAGIA